MMIQSAATPRDGCPCGPGGSVPQQRSASLARCGYASRFGLILPSGGVGPNSVKAHRPKPPPPFGAGRKSPIPVGEGRGTLAACPSKPLLPPPLTSLQRMSRLFLSSTPALQPCSKTSAASWSLPISASTCPKPARPSLKVNISWQHYYPGCSTSPWQLDGVLRPSARLATTVSRRSRTAPWS